MKLFSPTTSLFLALALLSVLRPISSNPSLLEEAYTYKLSWGFIKVGQAKLHLRGPITFQNQDAYQITFDVATNSFADAVFRVREKVDSFIATDLAHSLGYYHQQTEGRRRKDLVITIDHQKKIASRTNFGKPEGKPVAIEPHTHDPVSLVISLRNRDLDTGKKYTIPTTTGKEFLYTELSVLQRDTLHTKAGKFRAVLLRPNTKNLRGVFQKEHHAKIDVWLSDDSWRIPLLIKTKLTLGSFKVKLVEYDCGAQSPPALQD